MSNENNFEDQESSSANRTNADGASSKMFFRKRKGCPICVADSPKIDYKNPDLLEKFISEGGRMLPSRITNVCAKHQRNIKKAIRHSRILALLPFVYQSK
jgi:small subunit ribosomal protein S18